MGRKSVQQRTAENIAKLGTQLLRLTCRLVSVSRDFEFRGFASGFIAERSGALFLLSAGHALSKGSWCVETDVSFPETNETLLIPLNDVFVFKTLSLDAAAMKDLEFAFARIDMAFLKQEAKKNDRLRDKSIELTVYRGPLDHEPIAGNEMYSYVSWWRQPVLEASRMFLHRGPTSEFGMTYRGRSSDGRYVFELADAHKGHDYYRGASGSPIADPEGRVVSLVLGGDPSTNMLYGLPIKDYLPLLDLQLT